jgi:hypothetical protein
MSEGIATIDTERKAMKTWQVEYDATYWVEAETEDEAIELAIEQHAELPNGDWNAFIEPKWEKNV